MQKVTLDKEFQKLIPELLEDEYNKLEQNIIQDGCRDPLSLWEGILIDGHNRYKICQKLNIKFSTIEIKLNSRNDAKIWIINNQLGRRNLAPFQRIELVAHLEPLIAAKAKEKQDEGRKMGGKTSGRGREKKDSMAQNSAESYDTRAEIAKMANVSHDTYYKGKEIIEKASDEDKEDLRQNKTSINKVYSQIKLKEKDQEKKKNRETLAKSAPKNARIIEGDLSKVGSQITDNSVDLIFTDPPYDEKSIELYEKLAELAKRILKPGGSLICYAGHYAVPEICALMQKHLKFWWLIACKHSGASARLPGKWIFVEWKPLLWFVKGGRRDKEYVADYVQSQTSNKKFHDWEQGIEEAQYFIKHLTQDGELVCDPFCGSGTTCIAALNLKRDYVAIEKDGDTAKIARKRIDDFTSKA